MHRSPDARTSRPAAALCSSRLGRPARRGLTLMEVVCAVVLIGIAAPALLIAVRDATVRRASVQQQIVARWLACERLEDVIADRHSSTRGWDYINPSNYAAESPVSGFAAFSRSVSIDETTQDLVSAGSGYRRVTVSVSWKDAQLGDRSVTLATVLTDYDQ